MAFRMSDFGIPNYDTNVNVLYQNAVEHGESVVCGEEEYLVYQMPGTPLLVVLRFSYGEDGETPEKVVAHTFLDNDAHWQEGVQEGAAGQAILPTNAGWLKAEVINPTASGHGYTPMLFAESVRFGENALLSARLAGLEEGVLTPNQEGVALLAKILRVQPVVKSGLWLFSAVTLQLAEGTLSVPVSRDIMEPLLKTCSEGGLCHVTGGLSLLKDWQ